MLIRSVNLWGKEMVDVSVAQMRVSFVSFFLALALSSCAFVDESITLKHASQVPASTVGNGRQLGLNVVDERTTTIIGFRGPLRTAEIRTVQDLRQLVDDAVTQGLRDQGFAPVTYAETDPVTLTVQIRELSYETSMGFFTGGIHTRAALKAIAQRNRMTFEELYRVEEEERVLIVPTEASDAERINLTLSHVIDKMLADQRLLEFLAAE